MKKAVFCFIVLLLCATGVACMANGHEEQVTFIGKVVEKYEGSCLLERVECEEQYILPMDVVIVHIDREISPDYEVGDYLKIDYNGVVAESYPPQIFRVFSAERVDLSKN